MFSNIIFEYAFIEFNNIAYEKKERKSNKIKISFLRETK